MTCGLRFEKIVPRMTGDQTCECQCGETADRRPSAFGHSFAHTPTGPVPQNTGVHGIDHNFDQVIGRDAAAKWELIEKRNAEKDRVIRNERTDGKVVVRDQLVGTPEGGYRTITETERVRANENRAAAFKINEMAKAKTSPKE